MSEPSVSLSLPAHGGQLRALAASFHLPVAELLDFSTNLYPAGPPAGVVEVLRAAMGDPALLRDYPDLELADLRTALALYSGVSAANVVVANGMRPLLDATLLALRPRRCLLPIPAFGEYGRSLENYGVEVRPFPLSQESNFRPEAESLLQNCRQHHCGALLLANPHNPSGIALQAREMRSLVRAACDSGILILLDEAFIDFEPEASISADVLQSPNLIVFRSVTKFFAMAGLRVAWLLTAEPAAQTITARIASWPVSTIAALAASRAVEDANYIAEAVLRNRKEREWLRIQMLHLGMSVFPSGANYLLFRLPAELQATAVWERLIVRHGIVTRNCANFDGLDSSFLRVAVRTPADNRRLVAALAAEASGTVAGMDQNCP